jgi:hypothetical protein
MNVGSAGKRAQARVMVPGELPKEVLRATTKHLIVPGYAGVGLL